MCDDCGEWYTADEDVDQRLDEMARMLIQKMNCIAAADATQHHRTLSHQKDDSDGDNSLVRRRRGRGLGTPWTDQEHKLFLIGLRKYGKGRWRKIADHVGSKNYSQVTSHAQKYFIRQEVLLKRENKRKSIHDMVLREVDVISYDIVSKNTNVVSGALDLQDTSVAPRHIELTKHDYTSNIVKDFDIHIKQSNLLETVNR